MLLDGDSGIFVVADGMGGHAAGEVASELAVNTVFEVLSGADDPDETRLVRDADVQDPGDVMRERLRYAMNQASVQIRRTAEERPSARGMGTTVVALVLDGDSAYLGHVGDSRAYLLRDGELVRLTRDHTIVQQEIDAGRFTPELARLLPHRNILTQSVGSQGPVEPDIAAQSVLAGDVFVLCTDGLTDALDDGRLLEMAKGVSPDRLADVLTEAALDAGGEDNITVAVIAAA